MTQHWATSTISQQMLHSSPPKSNMEPQNEGHWKISRKLWTSRHVRLVFVAIHYQSNLESDLTTSSVHSFLSFFLSFFLCAVLCCAVLCCFPLSYFSFDTLCIYIYAYIYIYVDCSLRQVRSSQPTNFPNEDIEETYVKASYTCQDLGGPRLWPFS